MNKSKPSSIKKSVFGVLMMLAILNITYGQSKIDKLDELVGMYSEYGKFNGSILVSDQGEVIYKKGFGMANMEWDIPNQPNTKHRLGSITKQFTAMLILQLVADGKLDLQEPITTYLPDYPKASGDIITTHNLLTHTSGIPNYTSFRKFMEDESRNPYTPKAFVKTFADKALDFAPGEKFSYSNSGYFLLGALIEKLSGKSYKQMLQDKIFTPLNMKDTGYDNHGDILKNRATGYEKQGTDYVNSSYLDMSIPYAAGSLYSTVEDLYKWDQGLYTKNILPEKYMTLYFKPHIPDFGNGHYAYGWGVGYAKIGTSKDSIYAIGHGGGINGFNTNISRTTSDKSLVVLLNNTGRAPLNEMTIAIMGIMHDKEYAMPKKSVAYSLVEVLKKEGITKALSFYQEVKDSDDFNLNEQEMNIAGYQMLQSDRAKEAAFLFKLNVEAFPKSSNVYDSYGEALLVLGDKALGIENYKKSIKLNPNNPGGIKILKEHGVDVDALLVKVPVAHLKLLEGEYIALNQPKGMDKEWKIVFDEEQGVLFGNDNGYRYSLNPIGEDKFINPDDGASVDFNTEDKNAITFVLFGKFNFKKVK